MKKILSISILTAILSVGFLSAQSKIGYINSIKLIQLMPESKDAEKELQKVQKQYEEEFQSFNKEYENKAKEYQVKEKSWTESLKKTKLKEIQDLQQRMQTYQQSAGKELESKRNDIFKPILDKAQKAIDQIAKSGGYDYVIDTSKGIMLYANEKNDLFNAVKKKLKL